MQQSAPWSLNNIVTHIPPPPPPINVGRPGERDDEISPSNIEQGELGDDFSEVIKSVPTEIT